MKVRKAVVTAAGGGTRFLPVTKGQPKEMLPLVDKPIIQYAVEEAVAAGLKQIVMVTAQGKRAIEDYFDRSFELEPGLQQRGETALWEQLRRLSNMADIAYVRQKEQLGLGNAVLVTQAEVGGEPFALFLPDDVFVGNGPVIGRLCAGGGKGEKGGSRALRHHRPKADWAAPLPGTGPGGEALSPAGPFRPGYRGEVCSGTQDICCAGGYHPGKGAGDSAYRWSPPALAR